MKIPLIKPFINDEIKNKVLEVLESGYLTEGPVTKEFEETVKEYIGCKYAIAVTSCTTGLEVALRCLKIGEGDEVIIPDYTYPATASVISIVGAKTIIVDVDPETMLIDYAELENAITSRTKAVIPVSIFGNPLNYDFLEKIKKKYNLYIIEDAACALGSTFDSIKTGNLADISVFSFHPRKFITTGEGGMITTNNQPWAEWMNSYKHFGMGIANSRLTSNFETIGTNYKLSNLLSAVGLTQMKYIDTLLQKRRELASNYSKLLTNTYKISIPTTTKKGIHSYQSFCIFVEDRNRIMDCMRKNDIEVQIGTYSLHLHPAFLENENIIYKSDYKGSKYSFDNCLTLPLYHELTFEMQDFITEKLKEFL